MVRPSNFGFNPETAESNAFQENDQSVEQHTIIEQAVQEFDEFVRRLENAGVTVLVIEDTDVPEKTDAVFPNNWISTHQNGTIITYPMLSPNRRLERREDILGTLSSQFSVKRRLNLELYEKQERFLEGTGSMILDRINNIAYACHSQRTDELVFEIFCQQTGFHPHLFKANDGLGQPIYHTNVMMALGDRFAVVCLGTIAEKKEREALINRLNATGKSIIEITIIQMMAFAGNMLQLKNKDGDAIIVMSEQAYKSLEEEQVSQLSAFGQIVYSPLDTIEKYGGGSARCMIAEIFLPQKPGSI